MTSKVGGAVTKNDVRFLYEDAGVIKFSPRQNHFLSRSNKKRQMGLPKSIVDELIYGHAKTNKKYVSEEELRHTVFLLEVKAVKIGDDWFRIDTSQD